MDKKERIITVKKYEAEVRDMLKEKITIKKAAIGGGIAVLLLGVIYGGGAVYYKDKFYKNVKINGIVCGNMTAKQSEEKIKDKIEDYQLTVTFKGDKSETVKGSDIAYTYVSDGKTEKFLNAQNPLLWPSGLFGEKNYEVGEEVQFDQEKLKEKMEAFDCMKEENMTASTDAYIAFENNQFVIKEETIGTVIEKEKLLEQAAKTVQEGIGTLSAEESDVYKLPAITSKDENLKHQQEVWNGCAAVTVSYTFGEQTEVLDGMTVKDWMTYDEAGNYVDDPVTLQQNIQNYVQMLGEKYNTVGKTRSITSTCTGQPVSVEGGNYGFRIDAQGEGAQLLADIQAHTNTKREPVYSRTGAVYGENDIGDTYVEIDLTAQHLWYYKDGALLMDSDLVSGTYYSYGRRTPGGTYFLAYKQRNQVLRPAPNPDGSYAYESPVSYWMPFNGGIGLHDANWRGRFGGNIYLYSGSHGCINLPVSFAGGFYENIEAGCPIVCFYR